MKLAKVFLMYQNGQVDLVSSYRPISLLSIVNKLLEKIICTRLSYFFSANNILYQYQIGFMKFHFINRASIDATDNILQHLDNHNCGVGICIELEKAFDTVTMIYCLKSQYLWH